MRISDWSSDVCSSDLHFLQLFRVSRKHKIKPENTRPIDLNRFFQRFKAYCRSHYFICSLLRDFDLITTVRIETKKLFDNRKGYHTYLGESIGNKRYLFYRVAYRTFVNANSCRAEEHTDELKSLMRTSYAVFSWKQN